MEEEDEEWEEQEVEEVVGKEGLVSVEEMEGEWQEEVELGGAEGGGE